MVELICVVCQSKYYETPCRRDSGLYCSWNCSMNHNSYGNLTREEIINRDFRYEPETGKIFRKDRRNKIERLHNKLNSRGYVANISIKNKIIPSHHVIWFLMTGEFPPRGMQIDHINRIRGDNRWENLRLVTSAQNAKNTKPRKINKSGYKGVSQAKNGTYSIRVTRTVNGFKTAQEAAAAYNKLASELYGEFAYINPIEVVSL